MKKWGWVIALLCVAGVVGFNFSGFSQSPGFTSSVTKLDLNGYQPISGKNAASGYMGLDSSSLANPVNFLPGFSAAPNNTFWVKSGSALVAVSNIFPSTTSFTANTVEIGLINSGQYGIESTTTGNALFLQAGTSSNRIYIAYNQTIGGVDNTGSNYQWSVSSGGVFSFASGGFHGNVSLNSNNLTSVDQITDAAGVETMSFATPGITLTSGNFIFTLNGSNTGVVIPSTASQSHPTYALNVTAANALYVQSAGNNTFTGSNTFNMAPTVPTSSFPISATTGLQTALNNCLKIDGTNTPTSNISWNSNRLTNLGAPVAGGDAVNLTYLQTNYSASPVSSLTVQAGTPISLSSSTGAITISMPQANGSTAGFLAPADYNTFNSKQPATTFNAPLNNTSNVVTIPASTDSVSGYLTSTDHSLFEGNTAALTDGATISVVTTSSKIFAVTLGGNRTFSYSGHRAGNIFYVKIQQDGTGTRTVTWDTAVRWPGGSAPTLTTTANHADIFMFIDDGTFYLGVTVGLNFTES